MNEIVNITKGSGLTMSSREIAELCEKRHDHVLRDIERMLLDIGAPNFGAADFEAEYIDGQGKPRKEFRLPKDLTITLVTGYRADLRYRVVKKLEEMESVRPTAVPTTAEAFANAFLMIAESERRQVEQQKAITRLEDKVERVEAAQTVLRSRPANAETMTHLRARIGRRHGLSVNVIDEVMRQSPYAPKPAGMVRNDHVDADGSLFAVYWQKDVTKTFDRFVDECIPVTTFMFTHPFIEGRFRVARKSVVA